MRKWDLHVHTPASFENQYNWVSTEEKQKYNSDIWEKYVCHLENIRDIAVLGVCDYLSVEGYKKLLEYKKRERLQNFYLILPNIEFRLHIFVGGKSVNYHVVFSDELDPNNIEREFLNSFQITIPGEGKRSLNRENIEYLGKLLKEQQRNFRDKDDYFIGCMNITIPLEEILRTLQEKGSLFAGKYLLVLAEPEWALIDNWRRRDHLARKNLFWQSHAIFSSNDGTRSWALGKSKGTCPEDFCKEFGSLKPCIHGSDAHCFEKLCKPDLDRFCWIKADPTFEGLKQVTYEPEDRVRIQSEYPEPTKHIYTLDTVKIEKTQINDDLTLNDCKADLNSNIVAVTGGKGSGKTALLDLIANCFLNRCHRAGEVIIDKNSFVERIQGQRPDLTIELSFIGPGTETFYKQLTEDKFFQDVKITYLPQGKIEEYSGNREQLDNKILEIIFSNKDVLEADLKDRFSEIEREVDTLSRQIEASNRNIYELEDETSDKILSNLNSQKTLKEGEFKNNTAKLEQLTKTIEEGAKARINALKEKESELRGKHSKLSLIEADLEDLRQRLLDFQNDANISIEKINQSLAELFENLQITALDFKAQLKAIAKILELTPSQKDSVEEGIRQIEQELEQLGEVERSQAELIEHIRIIKEEIQDLDNKISSLHQKREQMRSLEDRRKNTYIAMLNKHLELKQHYRQVIETFSRGKSKIMSGVDFEPSIHFNRDDFISLGMDILNLRKFSKEDIEETANMLENALYEDALGKLAQAARDFAERLLRCRDYLKGRRTPYDLYKWVFRNYFRVSTHILFNGTPMDKLSIGQKGTVLLKLFLAEGDYPLIVDQPEENLDNKFIYDELVDAFREAKTKRQVIIATNNANLVVNTDAEQVIIAEFNDNLISYKMGTLEDLGIRPEITTILEGGKEAFLRRERRYGM